VISNPLPPGPKRQAIGGNLLAFRRDTPEFLARTAREFGDVAYFTLGPQPVYLVSHPDDIKDVLVTHNKNFMKGRGLQRAKRLGEVGAKGGGTDSSARIHTPTPFRDLLISIARSVYATRARAAA